MNVDGPWLEAVSPGISRSASALAFSRASSVSGGGGGGVRTPLSRAGNGVPPLSRAGSGVPSLAQIFLDFPQDPQPPAHGGGSAIRTTAILSLGHVSSHNLPLFFFSYIFMFCISRNLRDERFFFRNVLQRDCSIGL